MGRTETEFSAARPSLEYLSHRGPFDIVTGDLDAISIPGIVVAPETGPRCPAVIFGHGYLQPAHRYTYLLRYLASWGFVAAAPATERGPIPSHGGLALDMSRTAARLSEAKLHRGRVTVDPHRLAMAGHGIGGGAAVLAAAAAAPRIRATVTVFAAPVTPSAVAAAATVTSPSLHIAAGADGVIKEGDDGRALAAAWAGPTQLRRIRKAHHLDATEGQHFTSRLLNQKGSASVRTAIQVLMTAFLMHHIAGHDQVDLSGKIAGTTPIPIQETRIPA